MLRRLPGIAALCACALLAAVDARAQLDENHYLVYRMFQEFQHGEPIELEDQFGQSTHGLALFNHFATPVEKNGEPIFDAQIHQTWWEIFIESAPRRLVTLENQFGVQEWEVGEARYLVLPALKYEEGPPPLWNHYKCYEAAGPRVDLPVHLRDQFWEFDSVAIAPALFCNPCAKSVPGGDYPIVDAEPHLACYALLPHEVLPVSVLTYDQFIAGAAFADLDPVWLCLPSTKEEGTPTEDSDWGTVKSLYR